MQFTSIDRRIRKAVLVIWAVASLFVFTLPLPISADTSGSSVARVVFHLGTAEITIDDDTVFEGNTTTFTITLSSQTNDPVTVDYETADNTAVSGSDYPSDGGSVTFAPGQTTVTISIPTIEDDNPEPDETFFVDLSNVQGPAEIADPRGIGTILDDDGDSASVIIGDDVEFEGNQEEFVVSLSNPVSGTVTVQYYTEDETAVSNGDEGDYEGIAEDSPLTLTFQPGETEKIITVDTLDDLTYDPDETFLVILDNVSGPAVIADGEGVGTILDNDSPPEEEEEPVGGAAGLEEGCSPLCPSPLPSVKATKEDRLIMDEDEDGKADPGDKLEYQIRITNTPPNEPTRLIYVDPLSPHLKFMKGSLKTSAGEGILLTENEREIVYVQFNGSNNGSAGKFSFPLTITFQAQLKTTITNQISRIASQGTLYAGQSPTGVTDDPDTDRLDDPTLTVVETTEKSTAKAKVEDDIKVLKEISDVKDGQYTQDDTSCPDCEFKNRGERPGAQDRIISPGSLVEFSVTVKNDSKKKLQDLELNDLIDQHLELQTNSLHLNNEPVEMKSTTEAGLISVDIPFIAPGDGVSLTYWTRVERQLDHNIGYLGTNAFLTGKNIRAHYSDDPTTELLSDRTVLLLPGQCDESNYLEKWDRWLKTLSNSRSAIVPAILSPGGSMQRSSYSGIAGGGAGTPTNQEGIEREQRDELSWIFFGSNLRDFTVDLADRLFAGGAGSEIEDTQEFDQENNDKLSTSIFRYFPRYALLGAGELSIEPGKGKLLAGLNVGSGSVAGAGGELDGTDNSNRNLYIQSRTHHPFYKKLENGKLTDLGFSLETDTLCEKEFLPYILDVRLYQQLKTQLSGSRLLKVIRLG